MSPRALKESGYPWLGQIPEHWKTVPVKWLFRNRNECARQDDVHLTASQQLGVLPQTEFMAIKNQKVVLTLVGGENMKHIEPNDFLIHLRSFQGGIEWSANRGKVSPAYTVLVPGGEVHPRYFYYLLKSDGYVRQLSTTTNQLRDGQSITFEQFAMIPLPQIPLAEQRSIADFLDLETEQIDTLMGKQEQLIEVLAERRSAMITRAVTGGLDAAAPTQGSGVEWLGAIPCSWAVKKLKYLGRATIGLTYAPVHLVGEEDGGTLVLRSGNVQEGRIVLGDNVFVTTEIPSALRLRAGDILICARNGSARLIGKNAVIPEELVGSTWGAFMTVLRSPINPFLRWVLNSSIFRQQLGLFTTSTINQLTNATLHGFDIPVPPVDEQRRIVAHLDRETAKIDALVDKAKAMNVVLRERRSALISAAVTGKIDVTKSIEGAA